MSFINSQSTSYIRAKLTDTGRKLLASGKLTYNFWSFGDSEIDYSFNVNQYDNTLNKILVPKDKNTNVKYPIPADANGSHFNTLPQIQPIEQVITNVAKTRGFFTLTGATVNLNTSNKYFVQTDAMVTLNSFVGGNEINIRKAPTYASGELAVGDYIMIGIRNPVMSGFTAQTKGVINTSEVIPYLTYKIEAIVSGTLNANTLRVRVDREIPNFATASTQQCLIYSLPFGNGDSINNFYGSGSTVPYWNNNSLSFESNSSNANDDVPVWNMSIVYSEDFAGLNKTTHESIKDYKTKIYTGVKEYLGYTTDDKTKKAVGLIHYSNNSISNYYAEGFKDGTLVLNLPTVLYHKSNIAGGSGLGTKIGLTLSASTVAKTVTSNSTTLGTAETPFNLRYNDLVDTNGTVLGKVFNDLKMVAIDDEELLMAMSYKSNRNWTLPRIDGAFTNATTELAGLIGSTEEVYVTYLLANETDGYETPMHCVNYRKIARGGVNQNNIKVNLPTSQLPFMKTAHGTNGGFTANKFYLLVQKVNVGVRPVSENWKKIDMTSSISGHGGGNINPINLENSQFTVDLATYNAASTYNLGSIITLPNNSEVDKLQFGDEDVFFGNLDVVIKATAYKAPFLFTAPATQFNISKNPTYTSSNNSIYISEVGIYNNNKELVAVGKLSKPIQKKRSDTLLIQLDIDF